MFDATSSTVEGTTAGATLAKTDPAKACGVSMTATVWYTLTNVPDRDVVLRLTAADGEDAVIAAYRVRKGKLGSPLQCAETDDSGVATMGYTAQAGDLVLVGPATGAQAGAFTVQALVPSPQETAPGRALVGAVHGTVEMFLNEDDLWHVDLRAGTTYRLSFLGTRDAGNGDCASVSVFRPPGGPPLAYVPCTGSTSFTPGPGAGGRYLLLVEIGSDATTVPYRLQVAPAEPDDTAPGLKLPVGTWHAGRLDPSATDQLDMYRFVLSARKDVTILLGRPQAQNVSLLVLKDGGASVASGRSIRRRLPAGTYYVVVRAPTGTPAAGYRLLLRERGVSTISAGFPGARGQVALGTPVTFSAQIGKPAGRVATLQVDRFDPLAGWLFARTYSLHVGPEDTASLVWKPVHVGNYRVRITAPGQSGYLYITVDERPPR